VISLWRHIYGEEAGMLALFSGTRSEPQSQELVDTRSAYFDYPRHLERARARAQCEAAERREVYHCAHLLTARRRVKENAAPLSALYVDGDGAKPGPETPSPTAIVESSPGREQYYWRLSHPVAPEVGEMLNRRLAYGMGADKSGWDLTQLLRPPGAHNHKYPDAPLVVLSEMTNEVHDPDELDRLLLPLPQEEPKEARRARGFARPESIGSSPDLSRLSRRMQDLVRHGNHGEYETRSDADFAACIAMFGAGYEASEVWAAMTDPTNGISEKFFEKGRDGERYLTLTIGKAKARAEVSPSRRKPSRSRARRIYKGAARA